MNLVDAVALVTGAGQNIGLGIAQALASKGCKVVAIDVNKESLASAEHASFDCIACDVADPDQVRAAVERVSDRYGHIDLLVNTAGWIFSAPLHNMLNRNNPRHAMDAWDKTIRANLTTTFVMTNHVVEKMVQRRTKGLIINISSIAAKGNAGQSAYSAAKAGVNALAVTWAKELGAFGIRALAIAPGFIDTPTTKEAMSPERLAEWIARVPLRKLGLVEHIAQAVVAAAENDYLTGTVIEVDGGLKL